MPAAAAAAVATAIGAAAAAGTVGAVTFFGLTGMTAVLAIGATSFALSSLASAFASKPKSPSFGQFTAKASNRTQQIRQPVTARRVVYGEVRASGPVVFAGSTENNKYLHLVIALASHEVAAINEVWLNDDVIPNDYLDGSGNVISGKYSGLVRIKKHLGTAAQAADSDLVSTVSEWTSNHRLRGIAYIYVRLQWDREKFPTGVPNFSAVLQGKTVLDTRDSVTRWTPNIALAAHDNLLDATFGVGAASADVDATATTAAANACEEVVDTQNKDAGVASVDADTDIITLDGTVLELQRGDRVEIVTTDTAPGGLAVSTDYYVIPYQFKGSPRIQLALDLDDAVAGTAIDITDAGTGTHTIRKTGEPRYFGGGVIESDAALGENLRDILSGMGGKAVYVGGEWKLFAAVYRSPSVTLDEGHLRAALTVQTRTSRRERFNTVKGIYISPINDWQPADYPAVTNSTYVTNDNGEELISDLDLPFTQRPHTAQRLAKIKLEQARQEIVVQYPANMHGMQFQPCDTLMLDNTRMGWSGKAFEVQSWRLLNEPDDQGNPVLGVDMTLQETASAVYDWSSSEEAAVDPAPNTDLPDPFTVAAPTGLAVTPEEIGTQQADKTYKFTLSWTPPANEFVTSGGRYEIQFRKTSESPTWRPSFFVDGAQEQADILQVQPGVNYDVRIRAINSLGVPSSWSLLAGFTVSSPSGATIQLDYGLWSGTVAETMDFGLWGDAVEDSLDFGSWT